MDSPSAPAVPDPIITASAQGKANVDAARVTAQLNRANQITPYGSLTWDAGPSTRTFNEDRYNEALKTYQQGAGGTSVPGTPGSGGYWNGTGEDAQWIPPSPGEAGSYTINNPGTAPDRNADEFYDMKPGDTWTSRITLDPRVQNLVDSELATSQGLNSSIQNSLKNVSDTFAKPIDYSKLPTAPTADEAARKRVEDALYGRYTSRLDPKFGQAENKLRSDLMNRGIVEGSEAWKTQMDNFSRDRNDAYSMATQDAIAKGGDEMSRYFGLQTQARGNALTEEERKRGLVLNELNALRSGSQVGMPSFQNTPSGATVNPAPIAQSMANAYQGQMGQYNADVSSNNATTGAVASIASMALMAF